MTVRRRTYWILAVLGIAVWVIGSELVAPRLIAQAYRGEGWDFLTRVMGGRDVHEQAFYIDAWLSLARRTTVALIGLVAGGYFWFYQPDGRRRLFGWALGGGEELQGWAVVRLAAGWGLIAGLLEGGYLTVRQAVVQDPASGYRSEILWLAPLTATIAFTAVGILVAVSARAAGTRVSLRKLTFGLGALAFYGAIQSRGIPLHWSAEVALGLGLGAVAARAVAARPRWAVSAARSRATPLAVLAVIACLVAVVEEPPVLERRRAQRVVAADGPHPNVLLIILDTVRGAELGVYGYERPTTPNLDEWAGRGVVFDNAYSTAPWTLPSHVSILTGRYPFETPAGFERAIDDRYATLAEVLRDHGYDTGGFVANLSYTTETSGLDRGFLWYHDQPRTLRWSWGTSWLSGVLVSRTGLSRWLPTGRKTAAYVTDEFLTWLRGGRDRPFFAFLNYMDAHDEYPSPVAYRRQFGAPLTLPPWPDTISTETMRPFHDAYDASIAYIDAQLGRLFARLSDSGVLHHTVVIIASDHGEMFGEHGLIKHTSSLYTPLLHVPLIILEPDGAHAGIRIPDYVTLRDLPSTILDLAGIDGAGLPGASLARFWGEGPPSVSPLYAELDKYEFTEPGSRSDLGDMSALVSDGVQVIRNGDGSVELYDLRQDPGQLEDLGEAPEFDALRDSLLARLDATAHLRP